MKRIESKELNLFARNLCWLRKKNKISKARMARVLQISFRSMNRIEHGELPPGLDISVVFNAMDFFHVRAADLMGVDLSQASKEESQSLE